MRTIFLTLFLAAGICSARDLSDFVCADGVARAYVEVDSTYLAQPVDTNVFPEAVTVTGYNGEEPVYAPKIIGEFVLTHLIKDLGNGRTVIPLAAMVAQTYRNDPCDTNELAQWESLGLDSDTWMTVDEMQAAYPAEGEL